MLAVYVFTQRTFWVLNLILAIPALIILVPFIIMFPVGLGLKILFGSALLTVLTFTLLLPLFGNFEKKILWSTLFFLLSIGLFIKAHQSSQYNSERPKPNSLVYILNANTKKANWATYDMNLDEWTKGYLGEKPIDAKSLNTNKLYSKYGSAYTFMANAPMKNIPSPSIEFLTDSIIGNQHHFKIKISPNRNVNRYDIFVKNGITIQDFKANGVHSIDFKSNIASKTSGKILSYYVVENLPLEIIFSINTNEKLDLELLESSFDLLSNPEFTLTKRKSWMIPTPFVLTDAVIIKQKIKPSKVILETIPNTSYTTRRFISPDSLNIVMDSLK